MHLDFEDHHPDTPHLPPAFSRLERLLMTVVAHRDRDRVPRDARVVVRAERTAAAQPAAAAR